MRRLLPAALMLLLGACAQDDPVISQPPGTQPDSPTGRDFRVTAVEYEFRGVPETLASGEYSFTLQNDGQQPHELYLAYITGGQSIEELLELNERQMSRVTQAVDRAEAEPGGSDEFTAALVPGRFGYVCLLESSDGTPHAFLGMAGEFTVA